MACGVGLTFSSGYSEQGILAHPVQLDPGYSQSQSRFRQNFGPVLRLQGVPGMAFAYESTFSCVGSLAQARPPLAVAD